MLSSKLTAILTFANVELFSTAAMLASYVRKKEAVYTWKKEAE